MARHADPHARDALVAAARAEFQRRGLRGARIEDITAACGLSKGAFYLHYESKEALFGELVEGFMARMRACSDHRVNGAQAFFEQHGRLGPQDFRDGTERLQRWVQVEQQMDLAVLDLMWEYRDVFDVLLTGSAGTPFEKTVWELVDFEVNRIAVDQKEFQQSGCLRTDLDPELFGEMVVGTYLLVAKRMSRAVEKPDLARLSRQLQQLIHEGALAHVRGGVLPADGEPSVRDAAPPDRDPAPLVESAPRKTVRKVRPRTARNARRTTASRSS